jgi:hypothetical protein
MDPFQFEYLIADLLQKIGYENVKVTKRTGDKGIDVVANLTIGGITNVETVIQVKRYGVGNKVDGSVITQLRGSAEIDQRGLVITTSEFQKSAIDEAKAPNKMPVSLIDGEKLLDLLIKYGIGIKKEELVIFALDKGYFDNESSTPGKPSDWQKNRAIWPLPGGGENYIVALDKFLERIEKDSPTRDSMSKWVLTQFPTVKSVKTVQGYLNVPKSMGLIYLKDDRYRLTEEGVQYLKSRDLPFLYETISNNILAFSDIFQYLLTIDEPRSQEDILEYLKENFDIEWDTFAQVNFRLLWLIALGKVKDTPEGYIAHKH